MSGEGVDTRTERARDRGVVDTPTGRAVCGGRSRHADSKNREWEGRSRHADSKSCVEKGVDPPTGGVDTPTGRAACERGAGLVEVMREGERVV